MSCTPARNLERQLSCTVTATSTTHNTLPFSGRVFFLFFSCRQIHPTTWTQKYTQQQREAGARTLGKEDLVRRARTCLLQVQESGLLDHLSTVINRGSHPWLEAEQYVNEGTVAVFSVLLVTDDPLPEYQNRTHTEEPAEREIER